MSLLSTLKSRKALAGMVAVAAGTATVAAPVVALPLSANPSGDSTASPAINGGNAGTYESCSALFGLTDKSNANYVTFNVAGTANPLPGIGQGLTPVFTVTNPESGDVDECIPEIGFDDEASWFAFLDATGFEEDAGLVVPYSGTTGYLVPTSRGVVTTAGTAAPAQPAPAPLSIALRIGTDSTVNPAFTVTWEPSALSYEVPDFEQASADIVQELGGPASPLGIRFTELVIDDLGGCTNPPNPIDIDLAATLIGLTGVPQSFFDIFTSDTCDQISLASTVRASQLAVDGFGLAASVTVNAAAPGPGPGPGPSPTPGPTPTPVIPRFTG